MWDGGIEIPNRGRHNRGVDTANTGGGSGRSKFPINVVEKTSHLFFRRREQENKIAK